MLYKLIGGPSPSPAVMEEEDWKDNDPVQNFNVWDDDPKYPVPILAYSYTLMRVVRVDDRPCYLYQYAGRCDDLKLMPANLIGQN